MPHFAVAVTGGGRGGCYLVEGQICPSTFLHCSYRLIGCGCYLLQTVCNRLAIRNCSYRLIGCGCYVKICPQLGTKTYRSDQLGSLDLLSPMNLQLRRLNPINPRPQLTQLAQRSQLQQNRFGRIQANRWLICLAQQFDKTIDGL